MGIKNFLLRAGPFPSLPPLRKVNIFSLPSINGPLPAELKFRENTAWLDLLLCITKNTVLWLVECDKFKTFLKCSGNPLKTEGDWGNSCKQICRHKEWTLTYYHSFLDLSEKFFHSKAFFFLVYSVYKECRKSLPKTTSMCCSTGKSLT